MSFLVDQLKFESQEFSPGFSQRMGRRFDTLRPESFWRSSLPNETLLRGHILNPTAGRDGVGAMVKYSVFWRSQLIVVLKDEDVKSTSTLQGDFAGVFMMQKGLPWAQH